MHKVISLVALFLFGFAQAQELNCTVTVNAAKIGGTNTQVYKTLQKALNDFVNKTIWSTQKIKSNERINCSMFITINEVNANQYNASIQVQSSRPIFNSTYSSPILNYNDKDFNFDYTEFQNLIYNPNSFDSNLISVIAYYSQIIIGLDADTFALDGGVPFYETAQEIVNTAQSSGFSGWNQGSNNQNRYYLVNNLLSNTFSQYRDAMYQYHFEGLDLMHKDLKTAKEKIIDAISKLTQLESTRPNSFLTRLFFDAKTDEIVSIFTGGPSIPVESLVNNLYTISPLNASKWADIK
jgi:hypothetical protein